MKFQFDSLSDFLTMPNKPPLPDHGVYVWPCYLVAALIIIYLAVAPALRRRRYLGELSRRERLAQQQSLLQSNFSEQLE